MRSLVIVLLLAGVAGATPPEPTGPHPRMLLDKEVRAAWQEQAKAAHGPVVGAIALCNDARVTREHERAVYQGSEWAKVLQACLVAWAATDDKDHAATAIRYFTALLDDLDEIGDHKGGDAAASRDDGYAIRNLGPYTALAYDWLYDQLSPELRAHARARWKAWLALYLQKGYRPHTPGSNYHAGFLIASTAIAIAQAGEAGADGAALWRTVADEMWGKEMAVALSDDGVLLGGDWPEGWQYGPLAVASYALGARIAARAGIEVRGVPRWLGSVLKHHVYALSPADGLYAGGDTEDEMANVPPKVLEMDAIALGEASPDDKRWARGELSRLQLADKDYLLYDALAAIGDKPVLAPRAKWPTWYVSANTGTLYARTRWDDRAVWLVFECHATIDTDHRHPDAGNFVVSRGRDDVIVDPSPYGSQSTLTSNAPTVASGHLPHDYIPSQAFWSESTGLELVTQRASGVVAARCDYADQYKFQERKSDVPDAVRDLVMIPSDEGRDATVIVVDRASTTSEGRAMYLRFRTPAHLALSGETATGAVGSTKLVISSVARSGGKAAIGVPSQKDCYKEGTVRGTCDAARFPVTDYRVEIAGPEPRAVHVITATGDKAPAAAAPLSGDGWAGASITGPRNAVVVWRTGGSGALSYVAPRGAQVTHVILDARGAVTAKLDGDRCAVQVADGGKTPAVVTLDDKCNVADDPEAAAASAVGTRPAASHGGGARSMRSGCCGAQAAPGSSIAMTLVVLAMLISRRRRS